MKILDYLDSDSEDDILKVKPDWSMPPKNDVLFFLINFFYYPIRLFDKLMVILIRKLTG